MKFMKLGSKSDGFQSDGNIRYVANELATDIVVHVADVKFYLHKFPLLSKSARLQKLVSSSNEAKGDEVFIHDIPGGSTSFEICAKFCYGMTVNLNAYNLVAARCASEYLEMHETVEKGNLVYKIDVFLNSVIFRSWKDSIIVLQTTKKLLQLSEELKIIEHCIDAIASRTSVDVSRVDWSYSYNRKNDHDPNGSPKQNRTVPNDWWVEDLSELGIEFYKRVIVAVKGKGIISNEVIGEALKAYAYKKLPPLSKSVKIQHNDVLKFRSILDTIVYLLPVEKRSVPCSFMLKLLKGTVSVGSDETVKNELVKRIGLQLDEASVSDLLIRARDGEGSTVYDAVVVKKMVEEFVAQNSTAEIEDGILSEASKLMVAKLVEGYLAEIAKDPNLSLLMFVGIAEMVSGFSRPRHDGLYRAIDMFLKAHPGISKSERKRICKLMDCKKLSPDACMHAVQNERLPLRVVVQVLFFEQARAAASSGCSMPDLPKAIKDLNCASSRSATTNNDEDWDGVASSQELRALRGEIAGLRMGRGVRKSRIGNSDNKSGISKMKGSIMSKRVLSTIWSRKEKGRDENSGSDSSSESLGSINADEAKGVTPSMKGRHSVS